MAMGVSLDMEVIAEGIENEEQHAFLAARDCSSLQGFHFSRALPLAELRTFIKAHIAHHA